MPKPPGDSTVAVGRRFSITDWNARTGRTAMNLYKIRTRFVLVALVLMILPCASYCQALSKQNIIDLHRAAVDDSVLIQKVAHDGIDFEMSSETILELQKDGISSEVMKALLSANANSATTARYSHFVPGRQICGARRPPGGRVTIASR